MLFLFIYFSIRLCQYYYKQNIKIAVEVKQMTGKKTNNDDISNSVSESRWCNASNTILNTTPDDEKLRNEKILNSQ